ncbi:MAG: TerD family protein [Oscillospiraceae bacterium]
MVNLQKGQKISLTKESNGLKNIMVGLGWDKVEQPTQNKFTLFGKKSKKANIDCDASAILLNANGRCVSNNDVVYFANLSHNSGAVVHQGDNLTGEGNGDDEQILVRLNDLPSKYDEIVFIVTIYQADTRNQNFGMINNAFIRIVDIDNGNKELCRFDLSNEPTYCDKTSMIFGKVYRHDGEWKFSAIGDGLTDVGISKVVNHFK